MIAKLMVCGDVYSNDHGRMLQRYSEQDRRHGQCQISEWLCTDGVQTQGNSVWYRRNSTLVPRHRLCTTGTSPPVVILIDLLLYPD